jgi:UDP-N-acetylmuramoylalanine--D-glutamate ligase
VLRFSRHAGSGDFHLDGDRLRGPRGLNLPTETMKLKGPHNALNALAVLATLQALDLDPARAAAGLSAFQPLPHRLETVATISGIAFVNDSKATNSDAVVQALSTFPDGRVRLLAGGILKTDNLEELREPIERKAAGLYLFGRDAKIIARELADPVPEHIFPDLAAAFRQAVRDARPGDVVLLSPITASFDQYRDFQARGEHFRRLVEELRKEVS